MSDNTMQRYATISGILGVALFLFGLATYLFTQVMTAYSAIHLAAGAVLMAVFLFANVQRLGAMARGRAARTAAETLTLGLITVAIVVTVNLIASVYPKQFDWTADRLYSLSDQTRKVLNGLDTDVRAILFKQGGMAPQAEDLLRLYATETDRFQYEIVDPVQRPDLAEHYEVRQDGTLILDAGGRHQKVTDELTEEALTNALLALLAGRDTVIGFLSGHGELSTDDDKNAGGLALFRTLLEEENYQTRAVDLFSSGAVPDDIDVLVIASPTDSLLPGEVSAVTAWLAAGGRLLLLADPFRTGAAPLAESLGLQGLGDNMLIDQTIQLFAGPTLGTQIIADDYGDHEIVEGFGRRLLFAQACALHLPDDGPPGVDWTPLVRSSPSSWGEHDLQRLIEQQEAALDESDTPGPAVVAAAFEGAPGVTRPTGDRPPAGVVICDSDVLSNRMISQVGNADFGLNAVAWLAGKQEQISIRPKRRGMSQLTLTEDQMINIFYGTVLIFPETLLLVGLFVWWRRRQVR